MKDFIFKLLSVEGTISSKRFISIFLLGLLTGIIIVSVCGVEVQEYQFWGLMGLMTGAQGMTFIRNNLSKELK